MQLQLPPHIQSLPPYTPIEPFEVLSERVGRSPEQIIKLDANENPYGMSPRAQAALANLPYGHIYPDPESRALRAALSTFTGAPAENLLAGAGADELIDLIMRVTLNPSDTILNCPPTFGMYAFDADLNNAKIVNVPRKADFSVDVDGILEAVENFSPKLIFLTSPNNPDGSLLPEPALQKLLALPTLIILDEAYIEFAAPESLGKIISQITDVPNRESLIVLHLQQAGRAGGTTCRLRSLSFLADAYPVESQTALQCQCSGQYRCARRAGRHHLPDRNRLQAGDRTSAPV